MSIIEVKNLKKVYKYYKKSEGLGGSVRAFFKRTTLYNEALKGIDLVIEEGELVGFIGPNGAGKTTTLKILSGILYPESGEVNILGFEPWKRKNEFKRQISLVTGNRGQMWWDLPPIDTFLLHRDIYRIEDKKFRKTLKELTDLLEVKDIANTQTRKLSLGQRMKCELIASLLHEPRVLFLDEPTIGLDVVAQHNLRDFIREYNQKKKTTILLTSHYMEDVEKLCNRVVIINEGKIVYDGELKSLVDKYVRYKVLDVTFTGKILRKDLEGLGEIKEFNPLKVVFHVQSDKVKDVATNILNKFPVDDILINREDIEEVIRGVFMNGGSRNRETEKLRN